MFYLFDKIFRGSGELLSITGYIDTMDYVVGGDLVHDRLISFVYDATKHGMFPIKPRRLDMGNEKL